MTKQGFSARKCRYIKQCPGCDIPMHSLRAPDALIVGDRWHRLGGVGMTSLFLDELGSANPRMQEILLRVLEEHVFERVGGYFTQSSDFRLVAATNIELSEAVNRGEFREDLLYRLDVARIEVPPLRERKGDIPELAECFLRGCGERFDKPDLQLSEPARDDLVSYYWPGNIRELKNVVERASLSARKHVIEAEHLQLPEISEQPPSPGDGLPLESAVAGFEKNYLMKALQRNRGVVSRAAKSLQVSRRAVYTRIHRYGIDLAAWRS